MNEVVVIGSLNMDLVVRVQAMPKPGETVRGTDLLRVPGGKGANQAAAAARLGNRVVMVGRVGKDEFGSELVSSLRNAGVQTAQVLLDPDSVTGTAMITVEERGNNSIVISPGANGRVVPEDVKRVDKIIKSAKFLLLQLEIPLDAVICAVQIAHEAHVPVILNPAPAMELPEDLLAMIDHLILNEIEATTISGVTVCDLDSAEKAARQIIGLGVQDVVVTLGAAGSLLATPESTEHLPGIQVDVVDTTAAGDAFIGGFVAGLVRGLSLADSVRYGNCAGAITVTRKGAQPSLPDREAVDALFGSLEPQ